MIRHQAAKMYRWKSIAVGGDDGTSNLFPLADTFHVGRVAAGRTFPRLAVCRLCRRRGTLGTGSVYGFLFSVPKQAEAVHKMQGSLVQGQFVYRGPEIEHVPLRAAICVKALKNVLA
jgi:hypothetical protein